MSESKKKTSVLAEGVAPHKLPAIELIREVHVNKYGRVPPTNPPASILVQTGQTESQPKEKE